MPQLTDAVFFGWSAIKNSKIVKEGWYKFTKLGLAYNYKSTIDGSRWLLGKEYGEFVKTTHGY